MTCPTVMPDFEKATQSVRFLLYDTFFTAIYPLGRVFPVGRMYARYFSDGVHAVTVQSCAVMDRAMRGGERANTIRQS